MYDEQRPPSSARGSDSGSHMLNIRNARIRSENDVQLLRNRLDRLAQEERKALKKIEETRRRAEQIIQLKARNERTHLRKELEAQYDERQKELARERLQASKMENSVAVQATVEALMAQKKQEAGILREQRELINDYLRSQREQNLDRNREMTEVSGGCDAWRLCMLHPALRPPSPQPALSFRR